MKLDHKWELLLIFFFICIYLLPVFMITSGLDFRMFSDYDAVLPHLYFVSQYIKKYLSLPFSNPYMGAGIPVIGDHSSFVLPPLIIVPVLAFGIGTGMRLVIFLSVILAGISMRLFLGRLGIKGMVRMWAVFLYMCSGALAARFAAGHIDQFFVPTAVPLFLYSVWDSKPDRSDILLAVLALSMLFYSGTLYHIFYLALFWLVVRGYYIFRDHTGLKRNTIYGFWIWGGLLLMGSPKIYDFYSNVLPVMRRTVPDPFLGSIQIFLFPLQFMIPWGVSFYDRPSVQRIFGYYYNWYEYFAFLSPLPFVFLGCWKRLKNNKDFQLLLALIFTGALYVSLKYIYSPFYWIYKIIPFLDNFRVPQRIYLTLTAPVMALIAVSASFWMGTIKLRKAAAVIMVSSLIWVYLVSVNIFLTEVFATPDRQLEKAVADLRSKDPGNYYVLAFVPQMQYLLVKNHIAVANYYYSWSNNKFPPFQDENGINTDAVNSFKSEYIFARTGEKTDFSKLGYYEYFSNPDIIVWKTDRPTIIPGLPDL